MSETYSVSGDTANGIVSEPLLIQEILDESSITVPFIGLRVDGDILTITFSSTLPGSEKTALDSVVSSHTALLGPTGSNEISFVAIENSGANLGEFNTLDFVGDRIQVSDQGSNKAQITVKSKKFDAYTDPAIEPTIPNTPTFLDVTLDVTRTITATDFLVNSGPTGVEILTDGDYLVHGRVTTSAVSGNSRSSTQMILSLNGSPVPGTLASMYNRNSSDGATTGSIHCILSLTSGDVLGLRVTQISGGSTIVVLAEGSSLSILSV